jgi:neopullulanase
MLQGDVEALRLALVLLFVLPGVPCLYYGTGSGLSGGAEPACREAFLWGDPQAWPQDLRTFIASRAELRRKKPALRSAELEVEVFQRPDGDQGLRLVRGAPGGYQVELIISRRRVRLASSMRIGSGACSFVTHMNGIVPDGEGAPV